MPIDPGDVITSPARPYTVVKHLATGSMSDLYLADSPDGQVALKVAHGDGDQVAAEALNLARLHSEGDPKLIPFLPAMHDAFIWEATWVNVFEYLDGWYTLTEVMTRHPDLDPKDMAWMFRRLLAVAGFAHRVGLAHGSITPDNVMIHPEMHGLKLIDWTAAFETDDDDATNVAQAVRVGIYLLGGDPKNYTLPPKTPNQLRTFFNGARDHRDPWVLLQHFDGLIERMWGKRRFHPFAMT